MSLSSVTVLNHNTLLLKNVLQSWDISYMIHEDVSYFIILQLMVPVKTEYSHSRYVSLWMNKSVKHFKLIVLSFSCLIIFYTRPQDSFHQNQASGHTSCFVELPHCGSSMKTPEDFRTLKVASSHLWGHSLQKDILQNTLQGTELQNNLDWHKFFSAILTSSRLLRSV